MNSFIFSLIHFITIIIIIFISLHQYQQNEHNIQFYCTKINHHDPHHHHVPSVHLQVSYICIDVKALL